MRVTTLAFRRISIIAVVMLYLLIVMGGLVRTTDSGLGCPDWPLCYGHVIPPPDIHAIIEYTHRLVALGASLSAIAVTAMAFIQHRHRARIAAPTSIMATLLVIQIPLGGVVVVTELQPLLVALHLGLALLILAAAVAIAVAAHEPADGHFRFSSSRLSLILPITLAGLFVLLLTGALVVGSDSTFACLGWPLCTGRLLPGPQDSSQVGFQLLHRYTVAVVSILMITLVATVVREGDTPLRPWAILLGGLFGAQVMVGAIQVWLMFPTPLRVLHLATATAVWATLVGMSLRAVLGWQRR